MCNVKRFLLMSSSLVLLVMSLFFSSSRALDCALNNKDEYKVAYTILVDQNIGYGNFTNIQDAINSIPDRNNQWIRIQLSAGKYKERITIDRTKTCIFLSGAGRDLTIIEWVAHGRIDTGYTFSTEAENTVVKGITFKNTYNLQQGSDGRLRPIQQAVTAFIGGDKTAFHKCSFYGFQDTLWDHTGRHYFNKCYIQGAVDFIFGSGQSLYLNCKINVTAGLYSDTLPYGYITAQRRDSDSDPGGFVFKYCHFGGTLKAYLGRPWATPYARVLVYRSYLSNIIYPRGWSAGAFANQEQNTSFSEYNCSGPGADTSGRVPWTKKLTVDEVSNRESLSYIDSDAWINNLPNLN